MELILLETERLQLRERTPELLNHIFHNCSHEEQVEFYGSDDESKLQRELNNIKKGFDNWRMTCKLWDIIEKSSNKVIGDLGFHSWYQKHHRAEIGYGMHDLSARRKGYMHEAFAAAIDHGFNKMNLNRVEAMISPENKASRRIVEKLGFNLEGQMREHHKNPATGKLDDSLIYALLKKEYILGE